MSILWCDKNGFPIEKLKGCRFTNFIRILIHFNLRKTINAKDVTEKLGLKLKQRNKILECAAGKGKMKTYLGFKWKIEEHDN